MKTLSSLLLSLALIAPLPSVADTDVRVFGGIGISSGNLRIYITGDNREHYYHKPRYGRYYHSGPGYRKGWHKHYWDHDRRGLHHRKHHRHYRSGYRHRYPVYERIIIRDPALHDYRRYRHHRSYRYR